MKMETFRVTPQERRFVEAVRQYPQLAVAFEAMIAGAQNGELSAKSERALGNASAELPEPKTAQTITIEQMRTALRAADCLYDDMKIWNQLGANHVPAIPDAVIEKAYELGGRVILRGSSLSEKCDALRSAGRLLTFLGEAKQSHYTESIEKYDWIVVPSHIDRSTLGGSRGRVVTAEMPAPTAEDWFAALAYAELDGGRAPEGCGNSLAFTTGSGEVVGVRNGRITVDIDHVWDAGGYPFVGAARFGPARK